MALLFWRNINRQFVKLMANVNLMADGKGIGQPLTGHSEIARVDQAFQRMAAALARSTNAVRTRPSSFAIFTIRLRAVITRSMPTAFMSP